MTVLGEFNQPGRESEDEDRFPVVLVQDGGEVQVRVGGMQGGAKQV